MSMVADPDGFLLYRMRFGELPEEERRKVDKAYRACHELADLIERRAIHLYSAGRVAEERGVIVVDEVKGVAERFEEEFESVVSWLARDLGLPIESLEEAYSHAVSDVVYMARSMLRKMERREPPSEIYETAKFNIDRVMMDVRDGFVLCLSKLNVLKVPLYPS